MNGIVKPRARRANGGPSALVRRNAKTSASVLAGLILSVTGCESAAPAVAPTPGSIVTAGTGASAGSYAPPAAGSYAPPPGAAGTTAGTWAGVAGAGAAGTAAAVAGTGAAAGTGAPLPLAGSGAAGSGAVAGEDWPADCEQTVKFVAHGQPVKGDTTEYKVAGGTEYYESFYFKAPWGADDVQGLLFKSIIGNPKIVHHWIMYGVDSATPADGSMTGGPGQGLGSSLQGEAFIAGWAPGSQNMRMPETVGLRMPHGANATFRIEVHYNNTGGDATDSSGVEFCVTKNKRPNVAATHWLGSLSINIPAMGKQDVTNTCTPQVNNGPVHVLSISPHMHQTGVYAKAIVHRANGTDEAVVDQPFAFADQKAVEMSDKPGQELLINKGDTITTTCSFQNNTQRTITFGEDTANEMCFFFTLAWPAGELVSTIPLSFPVPGSEGVNCLSPI